MSKFSVDLSLSQVLSDFNGFFSKSALADGDDVVLSVLSGLEGLEGFSGGIIDISLLESSGFVLGIRVSGVEDDSFLVSLKSLDVSLEDFNRLILSSVVDRNANRSGEGNTDLGSLELVEGETSSDSLSLIVPIRGASDSRSKGFSGSGE